MFAFCLWWACALSTTYYISPTGDDGASGQAPNDAWEHLHRSRALHLSAGDSLLLERGQEFTAETLELDFPHGALIGSYGNTSLPRPVIQLPIHADRARSSCVRLLNAGSTVIRGLHLAGCANGLELLYTAGRTFSDVVVEDCFFRDITTPFGDYQPSESTWGSAIAIHGASQGARVENVTIKHTVGLRIDTFLQSSNIIDGLILDSNTVEKCGYNCVGMTGRGMQMLNSVFLRDDPPRLFMYGTTDVIVGTVDGSNAIINTDFNLRGEFEGGPDGCAIDFETSATGFKITGCSISRSWGGGVMVFGHATTSHNLTFSDNTFIHAGCTQPRNDHGGISFMCPGHNKPSGAASGNTFVTCPGVPAFFESFPGCSDEVTKTNNKIGDDVPYVAEPQLSFSPPSPTSTVPSPHVPVTASTTTKGAVLRYTMDASRPSPSSPVFPEKGIVLTWPGPNVVINVRGFKEGYAPSITNGVTVERQRYKPRGEGVLRSNLDSVTLEATSSVKGWIVDSGLPGGGVPPVEFLVLVDGIEVVRGSANISRPDLVKAHVAPNPEHGLDCSLPPHALAILKHGLHTVDVVATNTLATGAGRRSLESSPICLADGAVVVC